MGSIETFVHIDQLLLKLTLQEKVSLLTAKDWWRTPIIDREGVFVPHIKARQPEPYRYTFLANLMFRQPMDQTGLGERVTSVASKQHVFHVLQA